MMGLRVVEWVLYTGNFSFTGHAIPMKAGLGLLDHCWHLVGTHATPEACAKLF
jgi:hypothetical protein